MSRRDGVAARGKVDAQTVIPLDYGREGIARRDQHIEPRSLADDLDFHIVGGKRFLKVLGIRQYCLVSDSAGHVEFDDDAMSLWLLRQQSAADKEGQE